MRYVAALIMFALVTLASSVSFGNGEGRTIYIWDGSGGDMRGIEPGIVMSASIVCYDHTDADAVARLLYINSVRNVAKFLSSSGNECYVPGPGEEIIVVLIGPVSHPYVTVLDSIGQVWKGRVMKRDGKEVYLIITMGHVTNT